MKTPAAKYGNLRCRRCDRRDGEFWFFGIWLCTKCWVFVRLRSGALPSTLSDRP